MTLIKVKTRGTENVSGRRNIMYNGAMKIAQRGDQTSLTNGYTGCDRWKFDRSGAAVVTGKQTGSGNIPENGFPNAVHIDVTTADSSVAAGDLGLLRQYIESQDLQHLKFGTSSAESLTLSFWVKSSKTGTHWVEIYAYDAAKFNSASYTVSSANTWEKKTVTFVGETSTVIPNDNTHGFVIQWWLLAGSTYSSGTHAGNVWHATNANRVPGQVNVMDSTDNNFYLTGVQLEVGDSASDFEHRSFGEELELCKRYYQKSFNYDTAPENGGGTGISFNGSVLGYCGSNNNGTFSGFHRFNPEMRTTPTVTTYGNSSGHWGRLSPTNTGTINFSAGSGYISLTKATGINFGQNAAGDTLLIGYGHITADAEL